jgi:hypothetical protein
MYESEYKVKNYDTMIKKRFEQDILFCALDCFDQFPFYSLIQAITMASVFPGHTLIVVDDVITDSHSNPLHDTTEKLDLTKLNQRLSMHNIEIILKRDAKMSVSKFMYGLKPYREVDITDKVVSKFYRPNYFSIPIGFDLNSICEEDPMPNKRKHVYITYTVNGREFHRCYDEIMIHFQLHHLLLDFEAYSNTKWLSSGNVPTALACKKSFKYFTTLV